MDLLQLDVFDNMKKLWKSSIPRESPTFEDCIAPFIVALPDKSEEQDFKRGVFDLKDKILKGCFTSIRQDFASKANSIWQTIRHNQQFEFPVPDHLVSTSTINCERTIQFIIDNLKDFKGYDTLIASTSSKDFWEAYTCLSTGTSNYFDKETEICDLTVRNKKRQELEQTLLERFDILHGNILYRQYEEMQEEYKALIIEQFRIAEDPMLIVKDSVQRCMEELAQTCTYMYSMNKDAYQQFFESFQSALSDYAYNEAELIQGKRETAKSELAIDEMDIKASSVYRVTEAIQQEVNRGKEKLSEDKQIARQRLEHERQVTLASNQRARGDSQKVNEDLTRKLDHLSRQEDRLRKKMESEEGGFGKANHIVRTGFTLAGAFAGGLLTQVYENRGRPLWHNVARAASCMFPRGHTDVTERQPIITDVTEHPERRISNYPPGDQ